MCVCMSEKERERESVFAFPRELILFNVLAGLMVI